LPDAQQRYRARRTAVRHALAARTDWHIVEVGGGNGVLWRDFFRPDERGRFTLVDPVLETYEILAALLPAEVAFHAVVAPIQEAVLPPADLVTCNLILRHIAGRDARERRQHWLSGPGKRETLERIVVALRSRRGRGILTEADSYHDLALPPGDLLLVERFMESYFRRGTTMVADALVHVEADAALCQRWGCCYAIGSWIRSTRHLSRWPSTASMSWITPLAAPLEGGGRRGAVESIH
jgi:hypothetical protein